jgi:flavin-dependent dehydrogenase
MAAVASDVLVLGGGPAGCATAVALRQAGLHAVVIERDPRPRQRPGESLAPSARRPLEALGLWEAFLADGHAPAAGQRALWGDAVAREAHFIRHPDGPGWHLDRARFETLLRGAAERAGALLLDGHEPEAIAWDGRRWRVATTAGARVEARFAVDAGGRAAPLARRAGARRVVLDRLVAVTAFLATAPARDPAAVHNALRVRGAWGREPPAQQRRPNDDTAVRQLSAVSFDVALARSPFRAPRMDDFTLVEAVEDGWWYSAPLPDARCALAFFSDSDLVAPARRASGLRARLLRAPLTLERVGGPPGALGLAFESPPRVVAAHSSRLDPVAGDAWLAVGDAAASFDPLSSQGLESALAGALRAAQAVRRRLDGDAEATRAYAAELRREWRRYVYERARVYERETRFARSPFWRRRQAHLAPPPVQSDELAVAL